MQSALHSAQHAEMQHASCGAMGGGTVVRFWTSYLGCEVCYLLAEILGN